MSVMRMVKLFDGIDSPDEITYNFNLPQPYLGCCDANNIVLLGFFIASDPSFWSAVASLQFCQF